MSQFAAAPTADGFLISLLITAALVFLSRWIVRNYP